MLKFSHTDNGNCRVYYRNGSRVRCFQEDRPGEFVFYVCSKDGEPDFEGVQGMPLDRLPSDDSITARNFRAWRERKAGA
jgi:hypothetical protein